ncbi:MAG: ROK family protein [Victivallaceae bacterium]
MSVPFYVLGYDVGGTKLGIGLTSSDGRLIGSARIENKDTHPDDILPQLVTIGKSLVADAGLRMADIRAFGISAPYPADPVNGIMTNPTNNPKWRNVPIRKYLEDQLGIPGTFENDANCAALAEWFFGAGRGCDDFIYLTMSTGIGGGIIAAGRLVRGKGFYAGEIGHTVIERNGIQCACGLKGCYEAYCGGRAIALRIQDELKNQPGHPIIELAGGKLENIDMLVFEKAVRAGIPYAVELWADMCDRNAQAFGTLLNTFNPAKLVLGTFAWAIGDLFMDPVRQALPKYAWAQTISDCELVPSELRRDIGYYAGAAAALNYLKERA